jgi:transcriptional regulator with XRE-family HTH domain
MDALAGGSMSKSAVAESDETQKSQIDADTTERVIAEKRLGIRIKRLRLKKSMGLVELGKHTGLSASFLSQLETGRVVPTLRNLARIAMVFSKDLSYFFESEPQSIFRIHRRNERVRIPQTGAVPPSYYFESLGYLVPDREMDPYFAEFVPLGEDQEAKAHIHPGAEFLYLIEGELSLRHGDQTCVLEAGDSVYFDSSTPHSYQCLGGKAANAIIVTMQQPYGAHQSMPQRAASSATPGKTAKPESGK